MFDAERLLLTYENADYYGLKWINMLKFLNGNLDRFIKGDKLVGVVNKSIGKKIGLPKIKCD